MRRSTRRLGERGDTIVEVLLAIAIVSSVLAGAFSVTQKSTIAVRDSQERGEMLQILQGQVELVRSLALSDAGAGNSIFAASPKYFCIEVDPATGTKYKRGFPASVTTPPFPTNNPGPYPPACKGKGPSGLYNMAVTYDSSTEVFTFRGNWDRISGGNSAMQLSYRIVP